MPVGVALGDGGKDQHAGALFGVVQALGEELAHRFGMGAIMGSPAWHEMKAERRP
jgi:hypothetical protein